MTQPAASLGGWVRARPLIAVALSAVVWAASDAVVLVFTDGSDTPAILFTPALGAAAVIRLGGSSAWILAGGALGELAVLAAVTGTGSIGRTLADLVAGVIIGLMLRWFRCDLSRPIDPAIAGGVALLVGATAALASIRWPGMSWDPHLAGESWPGSFASAVLLGVMLILPVALRSGSDGPRRKEFASVTMASALIAVFVAAAGVTEFDPWLISWILLPIMLLVASRYDTWSASTLGLVAVTIVMVVGQSWASPAGVLQWQLAMSVASGLGLTTLLAVERQRGIQLAEQPVGDASVAAAHAATVKTMFDISPVPTMRMRREAGGRLVIGAANIALARLLGGNASDLVGREVSSFMEPDGLATLQSLIAAATDSKPRVPGWVPQGEVCLRGRDRASRLALITVAALRSGDLEEFVVHVEDVTARRAAERDLTLHSLYDRQTGLLNRKAFVDRLDAALHRLNTDVDEIALVFLDVDDFKVINDSLGLSAGDQLLGEVATRIRGVCAPADAVARLGGDEFAVISEIHGDQQDPGVFVGRLQTALGQPVEIAGSNLSPTVSVGVARTEDPSCDGAELMRRADLALYRAKLRGRGRVQFYAESMGVQAEAALNVRIELARAVAGDGFEIAYQPIIRLRDGEVQEYEALLRLRTADGRILPPLDFLDLARSAGLMPTIDKLVLRQVLRDASKGSLPAPAAGVAVNIEAEELKDLDLASHVLGELQSSGVDPLRLTIEVTESALLMFDDEVLSNVRSLRDAGVRIAIDDFGTGYSSLSQLRNLSADILKIDRAFVSVMEEDQESRRIVSAVIQLAHDTGLVAIAEGVETREQAESLLELGCDLAQGYLFGRPELLKAAAPAPGTESLSEPATDH
ncbi:MAG: EAL domain-containing protein [Candidatus Nanopelagicales bacterium]|nr:EAL domain-containing protein [Candidatus Nanopelagicales bacterium]MDZ4250436.1 EAL domain-containing protein [Candidatus Nanopelagicales bacterium]